MPTPNTDTNLAELNFQVYSTVVQNQYFSWVGNSPEVITKGYVYIFRQLRVDESNQDGTRTRLYEIVNLEKAQRTSLPIKTLGNNNQYFICYSQIKISQTREESIRLNLHKFLLARKKNIPSIDIIEEQYRTCRVNYYPVSEDTKDDRLGSNHRDYDYYTGDEEKKQIITIRLYDWYKYVEDLKDEYVEKVNTLNNSFETDISFSNFFQDEIYNYNDKGKAVTDEKKELPKYNLGSLYAFTKSFEEFINSLPGKYKSNLRRHYEESINYQQNLAAGTYYTLAPTVTYDTRPEYKRFLESPEVNNIEASIEDIITTVNKQYDLMFKSQGYASFTMADYYYGEDSEVDSIEALLSDYLFDTFNYLNKNQIDYLVEKVFEDIEVIENDNAISEPKDITEKAGDSNIFYFLYNRIGLKKSIKLSQILIFDFILQIYAKYRPDQFKEETKLFDYITNGSFKKIPELKREMKRVVSTDMSRIKTWYRSNYGSTRGKTFEEMLDSWKQKQVDVFGDSIDFDQQDDLVFVKRQVTVLDDTKYQKAVGAAKFPLTALAKLLSGLNIYRQVETMMIMQEGQVQSIVSIVGSTFSLMDTQLTKMIVGRNFQKESANLILSEMAEQELKQELKSSAKKLIGSIGSFLMAAEMTVICIKRAQAKDTDAAFFFGASAAFALAAGFVIATGGSGAILIGIAIGLSVIGSYLIDDSTDLFIKYCIWGNEAFKLPNNDVPSWWFLENSYIANEQIPNSDDTTSTKTYLVVEDEINFDNDFKNNIIIVNRKTVILDLIDENQQLMKRAIHAPSYQSRVRKFSFSYDTQRGRRSTAIDDTLHFTLEMKDLMYIKSIAVTLYQDTEERDLNVFTRISHRVQRQFSNYDDFQRIIYSKIDFIIDIESDDAYRFFRKSGSLISDLSEISSADTLELIFSKEQIQRPYISSSFKILTEVPGNVQIVEELSNQKDNIIELLIHYKPGTGLEPVKYFRGIHDN